MSATIVACAAVYVWRHRGQLATSPLWLLLLGVAISLGIGVATSALGLPNAAVWTDDPVIAGTTVIKAIHLLELQVALDQAHRERGATHAP